GCGIANALAAIDEGASHVQGTINGYGERCGNSNLIPIIANLELKMNRSTIGKAGVKRLTELSHFVDEMANQVPDVRAPYVGRTCFTHKGGIHVSAVLRNASTYEHIDPSLVGNRRRVLVSDQSGRANLAYKIYELGLNIDSNHPGLKVALQELKELEKKGYEFEGAEASFVLLLRRALGQVPKYFEEHSWRILNEKTRDESVVLGMVKIKVGNQEEHALAEGDGPFNALDVALRTSLHPYYPEIEDLRLIDYKVRVLDADQRTAATVRVLINYQYKDETWGTVGVSGNVIEASWHALIDSIVFYLFEKRKLKARTRKPAVSVAKSNNGVKKKKVTKKRTSGKKR
ncbi:MAG: citramalate synthase, partial [Candidatus Lindowbacteria bacterium]|nr:citramalate synthase [Candidatus Lindowbacteria bacterium]